SRHRPTAAMGRKQAESDRFRPIAAVSKGSSRPKADILSKDIKSVPFIRYAFLVSSSASHRPMDLSSRKYQEDLNHWRAVVASIFQALDFYGDHHEKEEDTEAAGSGHNHGKAPKYEQYCRCS
ncbi:TPA: hypothetical protein RG893_004209, partial [Pseudomonas aeruginosa]